MVNKYHEMTHINAWKVFINSHTLEQILSADKYPSIFSRQMEAVIYI